MKTRVMIVDDQFVARKLFEFYLQDNDQYEVVCTAESAAYAEAFVMREAIDLIIMDILMNDDSNGLSAAEKIKQLRPDIKIVAVTSMPEASWLERARKIGIESFWYKEGAKDTILDVIERTMRGESVYPDQTPPVQLGLANSMEFTEREIEVLRVMTSGITNSAIADKLGITENTVKQHIRHMMEKTGCKSRTELAIEARVSGLVIPIKAE